MFSARTILVEEKKKKKKDDADSECSSEDNLDGDDASCRYVEKVGVSDVGYWICIGIVNNQKPKHHLNLVEVSLIMANTSTPPLSL